VATNKSKINWSFQALLELAEIHEYLTDQVSDDFADQFVDELMAKTKKLEDNPEFYHPCPYKKLLAVGYRCMNYKKYVLIYKVNPAEVEVLAIMHSGRNPKSFDEIAG
jgi:plasmid stabilization system protein ParE